jgi:preprotein translocase subunit SecB
MADSGSNGAAAPDANAAQGPALNALAQYVKDLSFENPNAPRSLAPQQAQPEINVQVNVNARQFADNQYEVDLSLEGGATIAGASLFKFELTYGGVFQAINIPQEQLHPVIMIECPRLLFPFARQIIADAVRDGGFPPLLLQPIDFASLYQQRMVAEAGQAAPVA